MRIEIQETYKIHLVNILKLFSRNGCVYRLHCRSYLFRSLSEFIQYLRFDEAFDFSYNLLILGILNVF